MDDVSSTKHPLDRIQHAGAMRAESERLRTKAAEILRDEIPPAIAAGVPIAELARRAHMTRKAVYDLVERSR